MTPSQTSRWRAERSRNRSCSARWSRSEGCRPGVFWIASIFSSRSPSEDGRRDAVCEK